MGIPEQRPGRWITGMAAVLLPFRDGEVDWQGFDALLTRTVAAGLTPAVNMDTGYVHLLDPPTRIEVLDRTRVSLGGRPFVAGAFVDDEPGTTWTPDAHRAAMAAIVERGGTPVVFPSYGLGALDGDGWIAAHHTLGADVDRFYAFELSTSFAPFGRIHDLDTYRGLLSLDRCAGAKHSSLSRTMEWDRLRLRDAQRPDFKVFTGNDLAIDMVVYGSDYLLGLAAFAPDHFARRDAAWAAGDPDFWELNDALQHVGAFAFREPVPGYRHNAAQFLHLRGWLDSDEPHPDAPRRPDADVEVLAAALTRLER
ncbi:MAG TPA: dihydrodipicolinate synthase family protein [Acidimicrobiales bacterium]|nr:dihydrodipicolinate synthase family protein [Acidimicrobiales bacterium]